MKQNTPKGVHNIRRHRHPAHKTTVRGKSGRRSPRSDTAASRAEKFKLFVPAIEREIFSNTKQL